MRVKEYKNKNNKKGIFRHHVAAPLLKRSSPNLVAETRDVITLSKLIDS